MACTPYFEHPVASWTAPTALQAKDRVTFTLNDVVSADTAVTVTHNMGFSTAELAAGFPIVIIEKITTAAWASQWLIGSAALPGATGKAANSIDLTKVNAVGSGTGSAVAQIRVHLLRPHTIGR